MGLGISILFFIWKIGLFHPWAQRIEIVSTSTLQFIPDINEIHRILIDVQMVFQKALIRLFRNIIHTPILAVKKQHTGSWRYRLHIKMLSHATHNIILASRTVPCARVRLQTKMLETVERQSLEKLVFESFLPILLASVDFHSFLTLVSCLFPMGPQPYLLVNATIVRLIKLNVANPFPITTIHIVITCKIGI